MSGFITGLIFVLFIWTFLAFIKPSFFAPFLKGWPRIKVIIIFFGGIMLIGLVGGIIGYLTSTPEERAQILAEQQQAEAQKELKNNIFINSLGLNNIDEANAVKSILDSVEVTSPTKIEHDEGLDDNSDGTKGYRITADKIKGKVILYMNPNHTVQSVRYADNDLYTNNTVVQKMSDVTLSSDQQFYMKNTAERAISMLLKAPKTAEFSGSKDTYYYIKDGVATIEGHVDAQNSFGAQLRSTYSAQFDAKNDLKMIHLTFDNNVIF